MRAVHARLDRRRIGDAAKIADVGASREAARLGRTDDERARLGLRHRIQHRVELADDLLR
jgi:hypothetical protein